MLRTSIKDEHVRRNVTTRERWEAMASHRAHVMRLLIEARASIAPQSKPSSGTVDPESGTSAASLCVLGVGNGNDIDLSELATSFERIAFVDLDDSTLKRTISRLEPGVRTQV